MPRSSKRRNENRKIMTKMKGMSDNGGSNNEASTSSVRVIKVQIEIEKLSHSISSNKTAYTSSSNIVSDVQTKENVRLEVKENSCNDANYDETSSSKKVSEVQKSENNTTKKRAAPYNYDYNYKNSTSYTTLSEVLEAENISTKTNFNDSDNINASAFNNELSELNQEESDRNNMKGTSEDDGLSASSIKVSDVHEKEDENNTEITEALKYDGENNEPYALTFNESENQDRDNNSSNMGNTSYNGDDKDEASVSSNKVLELYEEACLRMKTRDYCDNNSNDDSATPKTEEKESNLEGIRDNSYYDTCDSKASALCNNVSEVQGKEHITSEIRETSIIDNSNNKAQVSGSNMTDMKDTYYEDNRNNKGFSSNDELDKKTKDLLFSDGNIYQAFISSKKISTCQEESEEEIVKGTSSNDKTFTQSIKEEELQKDETNKIVIGNTSVDDSYNIETFAFNKKVTEFSENVGSDGSDVRETSCCDFHDVGASNSSIKIKGIQEEESVTMKIKELSPNDSGDKETCTLRINMSDVQGEESYKVGKRDTYLKDDKKDGTFSLRNNEPKEEENNEQRIRDAFYNDNSNDDSSTLINKVLHATEEESSKVKKRETLNKRIYNIEAFTPCEIVSEFQNKVESESQEIREATSTNFKNDDETSATFSIAEEMVPRIKIEEITEELVEVAKKSASHLNKEECLHSCDDDGSDKAFYSSKDVSDVYAKEKDRTDLKNKSYSDIGNDKSSITSNTSKQTDVYAVDSNKTKKRDISNTESNNDEVSISNNKVSQVHEKEKKLIEIKGASFNEANNDKDLPVVCKNSEDQIKFATEIEITSYNAEISTLSNKGTEIQKEESVKIKIKDSSPNDSHSFRSNVLEVEDEENKGEKTYAYNDNDDKNNNSSSLGNIVQEEETDEEKLKDTSCNDDNNDDSSTMRDTTEKNGNVCDIDCDTSKFLTSYNKLSEPQELKVIWTKIRDFPYNQDSDDEVSKSRKKVSEILEEGSNRTKRRQTSNNDCSYNNVLTSSNKLSEVQKADINMMEIRDISYNDGEHTVSTLNIKMTEFPEENSRTKIGELSWIENNEEATRSSNIMSEVTKEEETSNMEIEDRIYNCFEYWHKFAEEIRVGEIEMYHDVENHVNCSLPGNLMKACKYNNHKSDDSHTFRSDVLEVQDKEKKEERKYTSYDSDHKNNNSSSLGHIVQGEETDEDKLRDTSCNDDNNDDSSTIRDKVTEFQEEENDEKKMKDIHCYDDNNDYTSSLKDKVSEYQEEEISLTNEIDDEFVTMNNKSADSSIQNSNEEWSNMSPASLLTSTPKNELSKNITNTVKIDVLLEELIAQVKNFSFSVQEYVLGDKISTSSQFHNENEKNGTEMKKTSYNEANHDNDSSSSNKVSTIQKEEERDNTEKKESNKTKKRQTFDNDCTHNNVSTSSNKLSKVQEADINMTGIRDISYNDGEYKVSTSNIKMTEFPEENSRTKIRKLSCTEIYSKEASGSSNIMSEATKEEETSNMEMGDTIYNCFEFWNKLVEEIRVGEQEMAHNVENHRNCSMVGNLMEDLRNELENRNGLKARETSDYDSDDNESLAEDQIEKEDQEDEEPNTREVRKRPINDIDDEDISAINRKLAKVSIEGNDTEKEKRHRMFVFVKRSLSSHYYGNTNKTSTSNNMMFEVQNKEERDMRKVREQSPDETDNHDSSNARNVILGEQKRNRTANLNTSCYDSDDNEVCTSRTPEKVRKTRLESYKSSIAKMQQEIRKEKRKKLEDIARNVKVVDDPANIDDDDDDECETKVFLQVKGKRCKLEISINVT